MPVNFLTDGKIIKGYNEAGRLVAVYDMYENYAVIEYEKYYVASQSGYRIARVYDNKNQQIIFTYTPKNYLSSITDTRGRRTEYAYDDTKLARVTYATGEEMTIAYYGNDIMSIWETKKDLRTELNRSGNKLMITQKTRTENTELSAAEITFTQNSDLRMNYATIKEEKTRERYYFNGARNCREYRLEENGVVTKAEQYEYVPYWNGTTAQTDPRSVRKTAKKTGLYQATLEAYTFPTQASEYDQETTTLDQFNNAKQTTTSALQMNASGSNTQTTVVDYTYDDNQKLVEEKTTVTYIDPAKTFVSYKKYTYNVMGDIVRKESYVEGEEYTTGKTIEESVYDDKGNVIKSYTYNSLDTSSKFYTETEYDENGKTVAKYDETGENKTKYEYVAGTSVVGEETLANGSKFAYGREMDGTVTAISQSTEEGEENSTQKVYKHGLVAELRSGNNVVRLFLLNEAF